MRLPEVREFERECENPAVVVIPGDHVRVKDGLKNVRSVDRAETPVASGARAPLTGNEVFVTVFR